MRFRSFLLLALLGLLLARPLHGQTAPTITSLTPPLSETGLPVYIAGTNLTGATSVTFNGRKAPFLVNSPELIVALVPLSATTGLVQVSTPSGTASSSEAFDVVVTYWDAVQNFSTASNPNGAWTYGIEPSLGGTFSPLPLNAILFTDGPCWYNVEVVPDEAYVCLSTSLYTQQQLTVIVPDNMLHETRQSRSIPTTWLSSEISRISI